MTQAERARERVNGDPELLRHHFVLVGYPWPDQEKHFLWVATASHDELIRWAEKAEREFLQFHVAM